MNSWPVRLAAILVLLALQIVPVSPALGQPPPPEPPSIPPGVQLFPTPAATSTLAADSLIVARAYYQDAAMLAALATITEPWEVHPAQGYALVGVDAAGFLRLQAAGLRLEIDAAQTTEANRYPGMAPAEPGAIPGYPCYRTVDETYAGARALTNAYPSLAAWIDIGDSWDKITPGGRAGDDLQVLRITNSAISGPKPKLFLMGALHAREYATSELLLRFAELLLGSYNSDPDITWIVDHHEIHLLLHSNPDGRRHAETGILWRKNTNRNYCSAQPSSRGADLNRNFSFAWNCCGASSGSECSDVYRGPSAASEPETQAIEAYLRGIFHDQRGSGLTDPAPEDTQGVFIDIHSYGELVMWPWGFSDTPPPNATDLQTLGRKLAYFNGYIPNQAIHLYPTEGTSHDFAYGELGVASFFIEVGTNFFQDCVTFQNMILPAHLEALKYAAQVARAPYRLPSGPEAREVKASLQWGPRASTATITAVLDDTRFSTQTVVPEPVQAIAAAEYYLDSPPWMNQEGVISGSLYPEDDDWDSPVETGTVMIATGGLSAGQHIVFVRARDAAGNWGPVSATFIYAGMTPTYLPLVSK